MNGERVTTVMVVPTRLSYKTSEIDKDGNVTGSHTVVEKTFKRSFDEEGSLNPQLSQSELIDAIVDKLYEKLRPEFEFAYARQDRGLLIGMTEIGRYLATISVRRKARPVTYQTLRRWWSKLGLPLSKTPQGNWCVTKSGLDRWIYDRGVLMRKLKSLGYKIACGRGKDGYIYDAPPEWFKPEEVAHARRELIKDRIRADSGE